MTYAEFLLLFLVMPSVVGIGLMLKMRSLGHLGRVDLSYHWKGVGILALIAFVWTTPWDNYLIAAGVWDSPADRIFFRIGYVPIEEYAFFVLMPVLNGAVLYFILSSRWIDRPVSIFRKKQTKERAAAFLFGLGLLAMGWLLLQAPSGTYLGLIILWFTPPLMIQWCFDPRGLWRSRWAVAGGTLLPLVYFALADMLAIQQGIWRISETLTTGWGLPNLPIEEFIFFGVTSLLLAQGLVLWHSLTNHSKDG